MWHAARRSAQRKPDGSPVTIADLGSQLALLGVILQAFPADSVIAEEKLSDWSGDLGGDLRSRLPAVRNVAIDERLALFEEAAGRVTERRWYIDPIDGTRGYLRGGQYAIAMALVEGGETRVAGLACPRLALDGPAPAIVTASHGGGAWSLRGDDCAERRPLFVSTTNDLGSARLCVSFERARRRQPVASVLPPPVREVIALDSQAKYLLVAAGHVDAYLRLPKADGQREKIWDHAPGALVVAEAGGRVTDARGVSLEPEDRLYFRGGNGIAASNGAVHAELTEYGARARTALQAHRRP